MCAHAAVGMNSRATEVLVGRCVCVLMHSVRPARGNNPVYICVKKKMNGSRLILIIPIIIIRTCFS